MNASSVALAAPMGRGRAALMLALLLGLQPVTTDLFLPALPALTRGLNTTVAAAQQTMGAALLAFGLAQLVWGPVADRIGRRPVLLAGLLLFTAAAAAATMAPSIGALVAWRALQAVGMAAAVVCARALVRDLYEPAEGAQMMALGLTGLGFIAIASPTLGGSLAAWFDWRGTLAAVAVFGAVVLALVAGQMPETLRQRRPDATQWRQVLATWARIVRHREFITWTALMSCTYGALFTMLAGSSFVFIDVLGLSPTQYGLVLGTGSLTYIGGTLLCRRWVRLHGTGGAVQRAAWFTLAGGLGMALPAALGVQSVWALAVPQALFALGHGVHQPVAQSAVAGPFPREAGAAVALAGFVLAAIAFGIGLWLGQALDGTVRPLAYGVCLWSTLTALVAWTLVRRLQRAASR